MVFGIGVDIVEINRFQRMVERFGDRIAIRLLTPREFNQYQQRNNSLSFLASRFAAKEAASKALGTGITKGIGFHTIEVVSCESGKPDLLFHDAALELVKLHRIERSLLSLSDEKHYAVAMVMLETR